MTPGSSELFNLQRQTYGADMVDQNGKADSAASLGHFFLNIATCTLLFIAGFTHYVVALSGLKGMHHEIGDELPLLMKVQVGFPPGSYLVGALVIVGGVVVLKSLVPARVYCRVQIVLASLSLASIFLLATTMFYSLITIIKNIG